MEMRRQMSKRVLSLLMAAVMVFSCIPAQVLATGESAAAQNPFAGKTVSILSHSMSTYAGVSNSTAANSTIGSNDVYYTAGKLDVYREDTWWQQAIDALGMELVVNNSWSGSCVFMPRKGADSVGYGDRAVNLHNDHTGEEPDVIWVYLGCNDFAYYKDTFGKADDVDYAALIKDNGDGTFTYAAPATTCEAYAIMLHKAHTRYPEAAIYCITSTARRDPDYADNYADTGQPTAYSAQLHKVAQHFSFPVVDLENCIPKEAALFDQYIGDKRAHCNPLGMDKITEAVLSVMLGRNTEIRHVSSPQGVVAEQAVLLGGSYCAEAAVAEGYSLVVTMDGKDVTADVCKDGTITIEEVSGDITVETAITRAPLQFRWSFDNGQLVSVGAAENAVTRLSGTVTDGVLNDGRYQFSIPVVLKHDLPWVMEWQYAGDWRGVMLSSDPEPAKGMLYLSRVNGGQLCFGTWTGSQYNNYGVDISALDAQEHTYRLENRIAADGSNMVYLLVDGVERGAMNHYFIGSKDQGTTSDWVSGKDFVLSYMGIEDHALRNCTPEYLQVTECDHIYENGVCTGCGEKEPQQLVDGFDMVSSIQSGDSRLVDAHNTVSPLIFENLKLFENCKITAVNLFVTGTVVDNDGTAADDSEIEDSEVYTFDLVVLDASSVKAGQHYTVKRTYTLSVSGRNVTKNAWNTFDVSQLGITVGAGETLGFGSSSSTLEFFYLNKSVTPKLRYYGHNTTTGDTTLRLRTGMNLPIGVEGYKIDCDHQYVANVTAPSCTEEGYTTHICALCGESYVGDYVDALGHSWANSTCSVCGATRKPYRRQTYFTVDVHTENGKSYTDNAVLYLPANYTPDGEPVKLVIYCKQGASQITASSNPIEEVGFYNYLISLGYAVLGVDGVPDVWRDELGICERAVGNPLAVQGTEKAYDYVVDNYNIADDGCFISGYSQGGHYAQNVIDLTDIPILAAAEQSPVCSMQYHQWDLNATVTVAGTKFTKGARLNVARIYGFPAFSTNAELLSLPYDEALVAEYDPWVRNAQNVYSGFVQKSNLWYLPDGTSLDDITMTKTVKCPVKIWCAEDDTAISADVMKVFVKAIQNAGGTAEISVLPSGGHGFFQKQAAVGQFSENGKTHNTLPIAVEIGRWFEKYGGYACRHNYVDGSCTICGEVMEPLSLRYDDHYDVTGKTVEIIDAGKPTSYQVGYGVEENAVPDTAVVTLEGDTLVATGIGTAMVKIDGQLYQVTVEAAPISLLLLIGQSNMRGSEGDANQSIVCPDGMVYATYGDDRGADNTAMTVSNATHFAPSALSGEYSNINTAGTTDCLSGYPVYSLTEDGNGKIGPDSGFAYEWVRQTGEKVWIVNAAHGGTSINVWQPGTTEYEQCQALFTACQETLRKEIAAGHFTLSHMAYFWCQGCSDRAQSAQWYAGKYLAMHDGLKTEMSFDHDTDPNTADKNFEFGGIIPVRVGSTAACYRDGVYSDSNPYAYHESFVDLRFSGPRVAQYWMINNPDLPDLWGVCNIGDDWVWMPDGTNGVTEYFQSHYPNGTVDYTTQVAQKASWYTPTTPKAVHDSIHYNQIGYNEIGREAVRNALIMLNEIEEPEVETEIKLLSWDGYTEAAEITASVKGHSGTLVVPVVSPIWKSKTVSYQLSEGLSWNYYDLLAEDAQTEGALTVDGQIVRVVKAEPGAHYTEHLSELPEDICCGLNLWSVLPHDPYFYSNGTQWGIHSSGNVYSVTIPVNPGERIFATAFGKAGENGHTTSNGIRVTFFSEYGVARTLAPAECYAEFTANGGYLVAPEGTSAVNIAMWNNSDDNEIYLLDRAHDTDSGICGICGKDSHIHQWSDWEMKELPGKGEAVTEERSCSGCGETETREVESVWQKYDLAAHYSDLPENVCSGLNLWNVLEHDKYYFANGTSWAVYSSGSVCSVTIPVNPGDRIFATAFGKAGENGHATSNGIRVTFFSAYGVAKTMTPAECYAEFSANGGCLIAPENAIAINVAMWNGSDENELYLLNRDHCYENGTCTICGAEHPNLVNYKGKVISILSASTSTFAGYIPTADGFNLEHRARYPQDNLLTDVNETWWMQAIHSLDAKLGINDSWAGSQVLNTQDTNSGDLGPDAAMASMTRIQNLGSNGTPDLILFFGGGNDMGRGVTLGSFDPETAPKEVDLTATKWDSFADAYVAAIMRLQHFYPDSEIVVMTTYEMPSYVTAAKLNKYGPVIKAICDHYGVKYVDLRDCGVTFDMLPDNIHPNAAGMDCITADVLDAILNHVEMEAGENVVHSVTHNLTNAGASKSYYKGVSSDHKFEESLTGANLTVTVTMGGRDITASVYANGKISIPAVTGDVFITAEGKFDADGHLQKLPEKLCPGINLWTALNPENIYYTATGWGNTAVGTTWSITFPVQPGDRIWATSLGKTPENGSSANGVRVTWFDENGVLATLDRNTVYSEFAKHGYITAPAGAVALNLPMTDNQDHYAVYLLAAEHSYESVVTVPTCTEQGYTTYTCACGESYVGGYVDALGHMEVVDAAVAPTCTAAGLTAGKHCGVCGEVLVKQNTVPALGHSYESGKCTVCGAADPDFRIAVEAVGEINYTVSGSTVTVTHDTACKVGYLVDGVYVKIDATSNPDGSYSFTAPEGITEVLVVISGDVNGDGKILAADKSRLNAALLKKTTLSAKEIFAADVNDDGKLLAADKSRLNAVLLKKTTLTW